MGHRKSVPNSRFFWRPNFYFAFHIGSWNIKFYCFFLTYNFREKIENVSKNNYLQNSYKLSEVSLLEEDISNYVVSNMNSKYRKA